MRFLQEKSIKINGVDYPLKMSIRAMMEYEMISGKSITKLETLADMTILFYSTIKAGGAKFSYDEFLDLIDNDINILNEFSALMAEPGEKKNPAQ